MGAVVAAESDFELLKRDPLGFFGVPLGLLDLRDQARVHPPTSTAPSFRLASDESDSRPGDKGSISWAVRAVLARDHPWVRVWRAVRDRGQTCHRDTEERG